MVTRPFQPLTMRQQEIVDAVLQGASNKEVAVRLRISEQTVKNQLTTVYEKLGINNRVQLALFFRDLARDTDLERRSTWGEVGLRA
jgi:two-component system, NarL family, nitrate/nitrite response regulator NarL